MKNRLQALLLGTLSILVLLYIGLPAASAFAVVVPDTNGLSSPPEGFTALTLPTADGVTLTAWYAAPENGAVILLIHGAGSGVDSVLPYAMTLQARGFGILALNLRGFGGSTGQINRLGWNGTQDVGAAVAYLRTQTDVRAIFGLGISLGGEVLLGAASQYPELQAIVSDGATFRSVQEYQALPENQSIIRNFTTGVRNLFVQILAGDTPPLPLIESITATQTTRFLFIAAGDVETEIRFSGVFQQQVGERGSVWMIPGVGHTGGFAQDATAYIERVTQFFTESLSFF